MGSSYFLLKGENNHEQATLGKSRKERPNVD